MKKSWQLTKLVFALLVTILLVVVMIRGAEPDQTANAAEQVGWGFGFYGFLAFMMLCSLALAWDALKKLKNR